MRPPMGGSMQHRLASSLGALGVAWIAIGAGPRSADAREMVAFKDESASAGTIVIRTHERRLYLVLGNGKAFRYPVGVGKAGKQWAGRTVISGKYLHPDW